MNKDLKFLNGFNSIPAVGPASLRLLQNHFGTFEAAWRADSTEFSRAGLSARALAAIAWKKPSINPDREIMRVVRENIWLITEQDPSYPPSLKEIPSPPLMLYGRGEVSALGKENILLGVVGTRRPTSYGVETTGSIVRELIAAGVSVVSGLATGIDAEAHRVALEERGTTIGVLGSGLDRDAIFPPENKGLAQKIVEAGGAIISEYAPGTPAAKEHFPARNRIISGLARGTLVVEAREKSGALITARLALEQNREVFAVPGSVFSPTSRGPNRLIKDGAKLVQNASDILEELGMEYNNINKKIAHELLDEKEQLILQILEEPMGVDLLKEKTGLETAVIVTSLSLLELKGAVKNLGQDTYQKII